MVSGIAKTMKTDGVMLNKRKFKTFIEGMANKYESKYDNVFESVSAYRMQIEEIVASRKLLGNLANKKNTIFIDGKEIPMFATFKQIKELYKLGLPTEEMIITRDLFVLGCLTSLRISDLLELKNNLYTK